MTFLHRAALLAAVLVAGPASAATVWSGFDFAFSKANFADPDDPAHQDLIVAGVALTRADTQGIYNAAQEAGYSAPSPADTEWAWEFNNPGETIAAANWAALQFDTWVNAHAQNPPATVGIPGVLHLISADVYLDIEFTSWQDTSGGGFSYLRAVPEPASAVLLATGLTLLAAWRRQSGR